MAKVNGTSGNDRLGFEDSYSSLFRTEDDLIDGREGDDSIVSWSGDDTVYGFDGDDTIYGSLGDDTLVGESGDDRLFAYKGDDDLFGGKGEDLLKGEAGEDTLSGNDGDDTLDGGEGDDSLFGRDDNDNLLGRSGFDLLVGGDGDDVLVGGADNDTLKGGDGDDIFAFGSIAAAGVDLIEDFEIEEDRIEVFSQGFDDIDTDEYDRFTYNKVTGTLAFDGEVFATLDAGLDFAPDLDIIINPEEFEWITNSVEQRKLAKAIALGIKEWLEKIEK